MSEALAEVGLSPDMIEMLIVDNDEFDTSEQSQFAMFKHVRDLYEDQHPGIPERFAHYFPRCRESRDPVACMEAMLRLKSEDDVLESLALRKRLQRVSPYAADEQVYLELPGFIGDYVRCAQYSNVPLAYHFWTATALLSAAVRRHFVFRLNGVHQLNQYTLLCGDVEVGRLQAWNLGMDVFERMNRKLGEGVKGALETEGFQVPIYGENRSVPWMVDQLTRACDSEFLSKTPDGRAVMRPGEGVCLYAPQDLRLVLSRELRFATDRMMFLVAAGESSRYASVERLYVSMFSTAQPEWFRDVIERSILRGGLLERVIVVSRGLSDRRYPAADTPPVDPLAREQLAAHLAAIAENGGIQEQRHLILTDEAKELDRQFYREQRHSLHMSDLDREYVNHSVQSAEIHAARLAGLLAVSEGSTEAIEGRHMAQAFFLLGLERDHYERFVNRLDEGLATERRGRMLRYLREKSGYVEMSQIRSAVQFRYWGGATRRRILDELIGLGLVKRNSVKSASLYAVTLKGKKSSGKDKR